MLIPESRRSRESATPTDPDSSNGPAAAPRIPEAGETVLRSPGSSIRRSQAPAGGPASTPLPPPGVMVGTFRLEEAIGAGGMGAVYRATDTLLERQVALKLLPPDQADDPEVVRRFYQEGRSAAQLDHENIARVFSIGQDATLHYIAFEFIEGVTLRHRVESSGPLGPGEAVDVALQIAQALVHASRRGVVHRDIKPSNIILTPQGRAKVVDMGLARRFERGGDHGLTQSGMTLGTFDYISPEQARDPRDVDVRSDLYSLGCTMFHMLTGRPPFPGGTVLQKLIQHQEEPPADVRTLNPDVPPELSAIIARLMAKERDRRYQGPEHLVRDLLGLAASLGFERAPSELETWMLHGHHAWWERHLVWLVPAIGFVVVIAGLAWWGRDLSRPASAGRGAAGDSTAPVSAELKIGESTGAASAGSPADPGPAPAETTASASYARPIPVGSGEDLLSVLATAPPRSVIVLSDDGPYRLGGRSRPATAAATVVPPDLTIRPEFGVRPVLRRAASERTGEGPSSLLAFRGGRVVIEGLTFELDAAAPGSTSSAIDCEDTELTLRGCVFRRAERAEGDDRAFAALLVRSARPGPRGAERPASVLVDSCHFDGGQVAVRARGPADLTIRDGTMGPASPSFWFDQAGADRSVTSELRLIHSSILAAAGPVFRFDGGPVRARVDDSVIAGAGRAAATLVQVEDPADLSWRGRGNLYGSIGAFLKTAAGSAEPVAIADFAAWEQSASEPRELDSRVTDRPVWDAADPLASTSQERENPSKAFLLGPAAATATDVGARQGPFGANLRIVRTAPPSAASRLSGLAMAGLDLARRAELRTEAVPRPDRPAAAAVRPSAVAGDSTADVADPMSLPTMPPMPTPAAADDDFDDEAGEMPMPRPEARDEPAKAAPARPARAPRPAPILAAADEDVIHGAEQFLAVLRHMGHRGGILRIGSGVDLELPGVAVEIAAADRLEIVAEPGGVRPRLRFRPAPVPNASPTDWTALLSLRSGSMRLRGLDLLVPEPEGPAADRLAAIAVRPGTGLTLDDCTVTVALRSPGAAAIAVQPPAPSPANARKPDGEPAEADAVVEIRDGFLRSGGDAVVVAGGGRLALRLEDVMVATEGSLLHALGSPRPTSADPAARPALGLRIDRVSARVRGGLVHLQTTREEPEPASVDIRADNSILSTVGGDNPLFRLEGQDQIERLRDRIRWAARKIAYHRIKIYRRDEIVQAGGLPRIYDRDDWTRAFEPTDDAPLLSDLKFRQQADATVPAWKVVRDDLSPLATAAAGSPGADAEKIPDPPPADAAL